mmetsp:Transcript_195/g.638  ORF Transcript_195/g.638 Transcript_195/m.638 type:complete len:423 (-) Transcript_195:59-1327(-)
MAANEASLGRFILHTIFAILSEAQLYHAEVAAFAQVEVSSHGQLMRLEPALRSLAEDWVLCQHFVRTEPRLRECAFDTCAVECGNCTEDDQCETGFYCSKTLKKCVDAEELECKEPTAHCQKDGQHCSAVFNPDHWVKFPEDCLAKGADGVRGGFKLIATGVDIGTLTSSPALEKAAQRALKALSEVEYDARWIGVATSLSEDDMDSGQAYVRFRLPVPGPVRREAKNQDVLAALERGNEDELHTLLALELKKEGAHELSYHVNIGEYEVMGNLLPAKTTTTVMHTDVVLDTTTIASAVGSSSGSSGSNSSAQDDAEGHVQNDAVYGGSGHAGTAGELGKAATPGEADVQHEAEGSDGSTTYTTTHPYAAAKSFFDDMTWWKVLLLIVVGGGIIGGIGFAFKKFMSLPEDQGRLDLIEGDIN